MEGHERGGTMKGQIGPVADQIYKIWNCTILLHEYLEEIQTVYYIHTKHSLLIINLHEQAASTTVVQLSDLAFAFLSYTCTSIPRSKNF